MIIFIDLFCGAGGVTTGIERAKAFGRKAAKCIAGINHDPLAIKSHGTNYKHVLHFIEDVRHVKLEPLLLLIDYYKKKYPHAAIAIWVSAECTNYSKAKGGLPRDADSRTLPRAIYRYVKVLNPDYVFVENVVEFMAWGKMDRNGRPLSRYKGVYFQRWITRIKSYGYEYDYRILNSADYGAMTKRSRYFCQFAKTGLPIAWPEATHAKDPEAYGLFKGNLEPWVPVKHALDLQDEGRSIFERLESIKNRKHAYKLLTRGKNVKEVLVFPAGAKPDLHSETMLRIPRKHLRSFDKMVNEFEQAFGALKFFWHDKLSENSLKRVYEGLKKFTPTGDQNFMTQRFGGKPKSKVTSINEPSRTITSTGGNLDLVRIKDTAFLSKQFGGNAKPADMAISIEGPADTITTKDHHALVKSAFLQTYNGGEDKHRNKPLDEPANTITTSNRLALVQFLTKAFSGKPEYKNNSIDDPAPTITTVGNISLVNAQFLQKYYTNGGNLESIEQPTGALVTKDRIALINSQFIHRDFSNGVNNSLEEPGGSLTTNPKMNLVTARNGWIMDTQYKNVGSSLDEPCPTIMACRKHHYLLNPQYASKGASIDEPGFTLIARMDKAPPHLVTIQPAGIVAIAVYEDDSEMTIKIKEFMALHGIIDIMMRMLKVPELLKIQGFPDDYYLAGSLTDQKKFIGNSVPPPMAKAIVEAASIAFQEYKQIKIAA